MSQQYAGALVILLMSVLKLLGVSIAETEVATIVTGFVALWVAFRRHQQGDITVGGTRK